METVDEFVTGSGASMAAQGLAKVVVTGGLSTALGQAFCKDLLQAGTLRGARISELLVLEDVDVSPRSQAPHNRPPSICDDPRVHVALSGSFGLDFPFREGVEAGRDVISVFHLSGMLSVEKQGILEECIRANVDLTTKLLMAAEKTGAALASASPPSLVQFMVVTLSPLAEGRQLPEWQRTAYGFTQINAEQQVRDWTRRGAVSGISARAPGILGLESSASGGAAARSMSQALYAMLLGSRHASPLGTSSEYCISTTMRIAQSLKQLHELDIQRLPAGLHDRLISSPVYVPGLLTTLRLLAETLQTIANEDLRRELGVITYAAPAVSEEPVSKADDAHWAEELQYASSLGLEPPMSTECVLEESFLQGLRALKKAREEEATDISQDALDGSTIGRKVAVISGAGSGIGRAAARALATKAGFNSFVLLGRRLDALHETAELLHAADYYTGLDILCVPCDIASPEEVAAAFAKLERRFKRCDFLFNNAGVGAPQVPLDELPTEAWDKCVSTNLTGTFLCSREAFRLMKRQVPCGGRIVNNGSVSADRPRPNTAPYTATKHAITGFTKSMALDGRPFNITCGQIDIGNASTAMAQKLGEGALQSTGEILREPLFDVDHVGDALAYMANLPLDTNVPFITVMASKMPLYGRG